MIPNTGGGATSPLDMKTIGELAPMLFADRQARSGLMPPWANGKNAKEYRATMGRKPIGGIFSVGVEEAYRWKDSVQSEAEIRIWVADGVANGLRPWFTKFSGTLHDRRWLGVVEDLYGWHHRVERYLRNEAPLARVGLVYSQQTAWFHGGSTRGQSIEDHALGWYQALIEARIPFEMVHDRLLDAEHLTPFKTLILPNIAALSDEQCAAAPRLRRPRRQPRGDLRDLALRRVGRAAQGLRPGRPVRRLVPGHVPGPMRNSYLRLEDDPRTHGGIRSCGGLEDAPRIINGTYRLEVEAEPQVRQPAADADPELSRPADGEGLPPRAEDRRSPRSSCARSAQAASSTSPGTSTASSGRCSPSTTALLLRNAVTLGDERGAAGPGHRARACST